MVGFMKTPRHLLSGTAFSACAERSLELALALALPLIARITVVHVCELGVDDLDDWRLEQCGQALTSLVGRYRSCGVEVTGLLRSGKPWEKLDNAAVEVGAGLIVVGRHGAGRGPSVVIGSASNTSTR